MINEETVTVKYRIEIVMKEIFKEKIDWISTHYDKEVNGFITGTIEDGKIVLEDLLIPIQESGSSSAEVTGANQVKLRKEYKDACKKIIGEWHSHHSLGSFWSADDEKVIMDFARPRETTIFIVSSKGHHLVRVEMRKPFKLSIDKLSYETEVKDSKVGKLMQKEIDKKVTLPTAYAGIKVYEIGGGHKGVYRNKNKYKNQNNYQGDEEREVRKEANKMVKYYNKRKMVEISGITNYQKLALENDFGELEPTCFAEKDELFRLEFFFKSKHEALEKMQNIKENLVDIMMQEANQDLGQPLSQDEEDGFNEPETYSGIQDYNRRNYLG